MMNTTRRNEGRRIRRVPYLWVAAGLALGVTGCSLDDLTGTETLPDDVSEPEVVESAQGAISAYHGVLVTFREAFSTVVSAGGVLSDELQNPSGNLLDQRQLPDGDTIPADARNTYSFLQKVRGQASQAAGLLAEYAPDSLQVLTAHVNTLAGYSEIFLADLFCSGIPLSTVDYDGDFTYAPGSTTEQVYQHAIALFDTARAHVGDSTRFELLARIGTARALLALGQFDSAAAAVADVPDDFRYEVGYKATGPGDLNPAYNSFLVSGSFWDRSVGSQEGLNGLDYRTSGDPRTQASPAGTFQGITRYHPDKYARDGGSPIVLASGVEARLIEAEAALNAGDPTWLDKLNHLRQTMWTTIVPAVGGPLPDLTDPGTFDARVDLLFRERAFWLFLTGQRQGDLRRLIRHYGRTQGEVYPVGAYPHPTLPGLSYGSDVDVPIPLAERVSNPHFNGCLSRGA